MGAPKEPRKKSPKKELTHPKKALQRQRQLLLDANADRGRKSTTKAVVNQKT